MFSLPDLAVSVLLQTGMVTIADDDSLSMVYLRVLRILRMARVLRMMRMMRYWRGLNRIVGCLTNVGRPLINATILLLVLMTVFALMAMQLFSGRCGSEVSTAFCGARMCVSCL